MSSRKCVGLLLAVSCLCIGFAGSNLLFGQEKDLTPAEVITRHLKSLGKPEAIAKIKQRGMTGKAFVEFIKGFQGKLVNGKFLCVSDGPKMGIKIAFDDVKYPGEYFAFDGKETTVGYISPGQRSPIADFIFRNNAIMREGLLGGVFSLNWPLRKGPEALTDIKYTKESAKDGVWHVLEYGSSKSMGNVKAKLYFEPKTFRHVKTEYTVRLKNDMSAMPNVAGVASGGRSGPGESLSRVQDRAKDSSIREGQADSIYILTEKFANFANFEGVVLPKDYFINYSVEGQSTFIADWAVMIEYWKNNTGQVDQSFFVANK